MSLEVYKIIHIAGLALLFASLGGLVTHAMNGGSRDDNPSRKLLSASHGVALLLVFVSGFGMHAKLHLDGFPGWFLTKVALWLALGAFVALPSRAPGTARWQLAALPLLGALGAWLALTKPF